MANIPESLGTGADWFSQQGFIEHLLCAKHSVIFTVSFTFITILQMKKQARSW